MIRVLTLDEMKTDFQLGGACYRELQFGRPLDVDHMLVLWSHFYATKTGVVLVYEKDDEKVGVIGGVVYIDPFDKNLVSQELLWYVRPERRSFQVAQALRVGFEEWSRKQGARYVRCAVPDQKAPLAKLLVRERYRHLEAVYEKELV